MAVRGFTINGFVAFTFTGRGSRRHGSSAYGGLLVGLLGGAWPGSLRSLLLGARGVGKRLAWDLRTSGCWDRAIIALQPLLHLPDPGFEGFQLARLGRDLLFPVYAKESHRPLVSRAEQAQE